jgi:hypothetical protein
MFSCCGRCDCSRIASDDFESDSNTLVTTIQSRSYDLADIDVLFWEVRSNCIGSFDVFEVSFVPRSCNKIAHELVQFGRLAEEGCLGWADIVSDFGLF